MCVPFFKKWDDLFGVWRVLAAHIIFSNKKQQRTSIELLSRLIVFRRSSLRARLFRIRIIYSFLCGERTTVANKGGN